MKMSNTRKVMDLYFGDKHYVCIEDRTKMNWYHLYEKWYEKGWHRKLVAKYADMGSILFHILQAHQLIPEEKPEYVTDELGEFYSPSAPWNAPGMKVSDFI
jgi:hypothetical protein